MVRKHKYEAAVIYENQTCHCVHVTLLCHVHGYGVAESSVDHPHLDFSYEQYTLTHSCMHARMYARTHTVNIFDYQQPSNLTQCNLKR